MRKKMLPLISWFFSPLNVEAWWLSSLILICILENELNRRQQIEGLLCILSASHLTSPNLNAPTSVCQVFLLKTAWQVRIMKNLDRVIHVFVFPSFFFFFFLELLFKCFLSWKFWIIQISIWNWFSVYEIRNKEK